MRATRRGISGPLLDRIDLQIEVPAVAPTGCGARPTASRARVVAERVARRAQRALERQGAPTASSPATRSTAIAGSTTPRRSSCSSATTRLGWSARSFHRVLRVARTIADLEAQRGDRVAHLGEAIQYRRALAAPRA